MSPWFSSARKLIYIEDAAEFENRRLSDLRFGLITAPNLKA